MPVTIIFRDKQYEVRAEISVMAALKKIGVDPEAVLVTRQGELITEDEIIKEGDVIKLVSVISGG